MTSDSDDPNSFTPILIDDDAGVILESTAHSDVIIKDKGVQYDTYVIPKLLPHA